MCSLIPTYTFHRIKQLEGISGGGNLQPVGQMWPTELGHQQRAEHCRAEGQHQLG